MSRNPSATPRVLDIRDYKKMTVPSRLHFLDEEAVYRFLTEGGRGLEIAHFVKETDGKKLVDLALRGGTFVFQGPMRSGKTMVSVLLLSRIRAYGLTCSFFTISKLRECFSYGDVWFEPDLPMAQRVREVDALVIDDIRENDLSSRTFGAVELERLVRERADEQRATVLTIRTPHGPMVSEIISAIQSPVFFNFVFPGSNAPSPSTPASDSQVPRSRRKN